MNIKLLDCTLRDGGYYNNWDFDQNTVDQYLKSVSNSLIDIVEIGFRFLPKKTFYGPFAFSTDDYLNQLALPDGPVYGVMVNGKEFIEDGNDVKKLSKIYVAGYPLGKGLSDDLKISSGIVSSIKGFEELKTMSGESEIILQPETSLTKTQHWMMGT